MKLRNAGLILGLVACTKTAAPADPKLLHIDVDSACSALDMLSSAAADLRKGVTQAWEAGSQPAASNACLSSDSMHGYIGLVAAKLFQQDSRFLGFSEMASQLATVHLDCGTIAIADQASKDKTWRLLDDDAKQEQKLAAACRSVVKETK